MPRLEVAEERAPARCADDGTFRSVVALGSGTERSLTLTPQPGEAFWMLADRLAGIVATDRLQVAKLTVFGPAGDYNDGMTDLCDAFGSVDWPVTWVDGRACDGNGVAGLTAHCIEGLPVERLRLGGRCIGCVVDDRAARYAILGGIGPSDVRAARPEQVRDVFCAIEDALALAGMAFHDVARTWLFVDRILDWYGQLNTARTAFFNEREVFGGVVPASTGIGCANPFDAGLIAEVYAFQPKADDCCIYAAPSPLQGSARDYGSSFSRAVEISVPCVRRLFISGTASIAPDGRTIFLDDVVGQIRKTGEVVSAILESRGMSARDVTRAIAYFRRAEDAAGIRERLADVGLGGIPLIVTRADVCRDDLLFEIEVDAAAV